MSIVVGVPGLPGAAVFSLSLVVPRIGAWHCDLTCDSQEGLTGAVEIRVNETTTLAGTVDVTTQAQTVAQGKTSVRIVGGANGMRRAVTARDYDQPAFRNVLRDVLADAGETASATIASGVLSRQMNHWTTLQSTAGAALRNLVELGAPGLSWRVLTDGTVWVGEETWPVWPIAGVTMEEGPADRTIMVGLDQPLLLPGYAIDDRKIDAVEITAGAERMRALVWFVDE